MNINGIIKDSSRFRIAFFFICALLAFNVRAELQPEALNSEFTGQNLSVMSDENTSRILYPSVKKVVEKNNTVFETNLTPRIYPFMLSTNEKTTGAIKIQTISINKVINRDSVISTSTADSWIVTFINNVKQFFSLQQEANFPTDEPQIKTPHNIESNLISQFYKPANSMSFMPPVQTLGVSVTENFDTIGASPTVTLPADWRVDSGTATTNYASAANATTQAAGTSGTGIVSGTSTGGTYNFANGVTASSTDRAIGWLTSNGYTSPRQLFVKLTNNTGSTVSELTISYDIEKYRSGSRAYTITFFSSTDGVNWTARTAGNQSYAANANNTTVSNPPTVINKSFTITGLSIANGADYYFRWAYTGTGGSNNAQGLAIDNFSVTAISAPEINVKGNNTTINDGDTTPSTADHTDFGSVMTGGVFSRSYTIENTGAADLTGGAITLNGANAAEFTVTSPPTFPVPPGVSTTFTIQFSPSASGARTATVNIANNDGNENPYDFTIRGTGATALSGSVNVGSGQTYTSLTNPSGLFEAINSGIVTGDVTANITSDLTAESGGVKLNQWSETGAGGYYLTIKPSGAARIINSTASATDVINLNGADRVIFDGSLNGGADRGLTITNTNTSSFQTDVFFIGSLGANAGANNITIKNCVINGGRLGDTSVSIYTQGIYAGAFDGRIAGPDNDNLTIQNNQFLKMTLGIQAYGSDTVANYNDNLVIRGNTFGDTVNANSIAYRAIELGNTTNGNVGGNIIQNVSNVNNQSSNQFGILLGSGFINSSVTGNDISKVQYLGTNGWGGRGIGIYTGNSASNLIIANNFVSDIVGDGWNDFGNGAGYGIGIGSGTGGVKLYDNSVNLGSGSFTGHPNGTVSAAFFVDSTAAALDVRGNIFATNLDNTATTGDKTYAIYSDAPNTAFTQINYNDYYASGAGGVLGFLGNDQTNIGAWQTATGKDGQSTDGDPLFTSATDLHIADSLSAALNTGTPIPGITIDFDGELRNATTPDIGADEFTGMVVPLITVTGGPLNFPNTSACNTSAEQSYTVSGANLNADIIVTAPSTNFQISTTSGTGFGSIVTLVQTVGTVGNTTIYVRFTPQSQGLKSGNITHTSTGAATKNVAVSGLAPIILNGSLDVGAGQTFTSLTNPGGLFEAINSAGLSGNLTVNITSDLTDESGEIFLNQWTETGDGGYYLTIKPGAAPRQISTPAASNVFQLINLNGADRVIIDGSLSGGTDRSLTLTSNTTTAANTPVIFVGSLGAGAGANNVTIKNCIIQASVKGRYSFSPVTWGILTANASASFNGEDNDNLTIQNNQFVRASFGVYIYGGDNVATYDDNLIIQGNTFGDASTDSNSIGARAIELGYVINASVSGNTIRNINTPTNESIASPVGIRLSQNVVNSSVTGNTITNIRHTATSGSNFGSKGISIQTENVASNLIIANNFISDLRGRSRNDFVDSIVGISIEGSTGGVKIYNNSVNLGSGNFTVGTLGTRSAAFFVGTDATALDVRGNIFATNLDNTSTANDKTYAIYSEAASSAFTNINYNDYYVTGTPGVLGYSGGDQTTIAAWRTASGQDAQSISSDPLFISTTNLHILNSTSAVSNTGIPLAGITTDIDGETRSATMPDIGADEFLTPTAAAIEISGRVFLPEEIGLTNAFVTITDMRGYARTVKSGKFGRFRFTGVVAGETYILSVSSRHYTFAPQVITATENMTEINFAPLE